MKEIPDKECKHNFRVSCFTPDGYRVNCKLEMIRGVANRLFDIQEDGSYANQALIDELLETIKGEMNGRF